MGNLTKSEADVLRECETIIGRGIATFVEVGQALLKIRDERLYRASYKAFEEYCREKWGWGRNYVNKQIAAAEIVQDLGTRVPNVNGITERQARVLVRLPPEARREIASRFNGKLPSVKALGEMVREERRRRGELPEEEPEPEMSEEEQEYLRDLEQRNKRNSEYNHRIFQFVDAIETLSRPKIPIGEVAAEIRKMDTPDKDWRGQARAAERNLKQLAKEMNS